ncbi:MAG: hypothetical protein LBL42_06790 [Tannerella sp.]|jgi:NAD(P)H-dependent flavin oxidoreductase YrpB (nitropropane dioxygenase family)|nr:hypothetical protein [Tannerella sp.]
MRLIFIGNREICLPVVQGGTGAGVSLSGTVAAVAREGRAGAVSCAGRGLLYRREPGDYPAGIISNVKDVITKLKNRFEVARKSNNQPNS